MYKSDFPIFKTQKKPFVFFDTAASAQKPAVVIKAMSEMYKTCYANVHRGLYRLSDEASAAFEQARQTVAQFIGAQSQDIIWTRGATESINLVAHSFGQTLKAGDEIVLSVAEHHSNLVPWQVLRDQKGVVLKFVPVFPNGLPDMKVYAGSLTKKTKLVAMTHMSNVLGTVFPVEEMIKQAHQVGAKVLIDGTQSIVHRPVNVARMGCDFFVFSGHKLYGPTGIGVLYAPHAWMNTLPPYQTGGQMIKTVTLEKTTYAESPARFEAGTPPIVEAIGLAKAIDYVKSIGWDKIQKHEERISALLMQTLADCLFVEPLGAWAEKKGLVAFNIKGVHAYDVGTFLGLSGLAVRVGLHCAEPLAQAFHVPGSVRISLGLYNDEKDIQALAAALAKLKKVYAL
ncbi:MAG: SufS family cysteine desulfurase [Alphaproteobacteria bacterium]|nr:SufS family cysteine desulfurase [Alphaproteobacteria bacterium]